MRAVNCVIAGGTGTVGRELVARLLRVNVHPIVLSRDEYKQALLKREYPQITTYLCDIRSRSRVQNVFRHILDTYGPIGYLFNCAALKRVDIGELCPSEFLETDFYGAVNLVEVFGEFCGGNKTARFPGRAILISSDKASSPVTVYGAVKLLAERAWVKVGYACARYGNVVNSRGSALSLFQDLVARKQKAPITHLDATRFYMTVDSAASFIFSLMRLASRPGVYIPGKLKSFKVFDLTKLMWQDAGLGENWFEIVGLRRIEKIHETLVSTDELSQAFQVGNLDIVYLGSSPESDWPKWTRVISSSETERLSEEELRNVSQLEVFR